MIRTRRQGPAAPPLSLAWVDLLLCTTRTPEELAAFEAQGIEYDSWLSFFVEDGEIATMYRAHRAALIAEWRRRGRSGLPWGERLFMTESAHAE